MANSTQPKIKPSPYTGLGDDDQFGIDRVTPVSPPVSGGSWTTVSVLIALAIVAALGYFYFADGVTTSTNTSTPPVTTQETAPPQPVPADPPAAPLQNAPAPAAPVN
jgi:hypothetical protein